MIHWVNKNCFSNRPDDITESAICDPFTRKILPIFPTLHDYWQSRFKVKKINQISMVCPLAGSHKSRTTEAFHDVPFSSYQVPNFATEISDAD
jgi:hypothetical protein